MEMSVYVQAPADLPPGNDPTESIGGLVVPRAGLDALQKIKHFKINS